MAMRLIVWLLAPVLVCLACTSPAAAQTVIDVDTGFSGTINSGDAINLIGPGGLVTGDVTDNGELWLNNADVATQVIPYAISGSGVVVLWQPVTVTFSGTNTYAGGTYLYDGVTTIAAGGSIYHPSADFTVDGVSGTLLNINGSLTDADASLGFSAGSFGDVTVNAGARWTTLGTLYAGKSGTSAVTITGGTTSANEAYFGYNGTGYGTLSISGGVLQTSSAMYFGYVGNSSFEMTGGSVASAGDLYVSYGPGTASGTVTSGTLSAVGTLTVGKNGSGSLLIDGGYVSAGDAVIGQSANGLGTGIGIVTVSSGSFAVSDTLEVGSTSGGVGTLNINGGLVTSDFAFIGNLGGSKGTVHVSAGSLTLSGTNPQGNLQVGYLGNGYLDVSGGSVTATGGNIGWGTTGSGTVSMSAGDLSVTGEMDIGGFGNGTLLLSGGILSTDQVILGKGNHLGVVGSGTVRVSGGDWVNTLSLTVGQFGNGDMAVSGGHVSASAGYIGSADTLATTGVGLLTVTGGTVAFDGDVYVGNAFPGSTGAGTLTVSGSSGVVTVNGVLNRASNGTINLNSGGTLSIGIGGTTGELATDLTDNGLLIFNRSNNYEYGGTLSGTGAVTKLGAGTLTFSGTSSYNGDTSVNDGTLIVNGELGATALTVYSGATLSGSGSILGPVTILSSGTLDPGIGVGALTVDSLSLVAGSTTLIEITGSSAGLYDQLIGSGTGAMQYGGEMHITLSGSYVNFTTFDLYSQFTPRTGDFDAITLAATGEYAGLTFTDNGGVWTTGFTIHNQQLRFSTVSGELIVVPEPSACVLAVMGIGAGWIALRKRRKAGSHSAGPGEA